MIIFLIPSACVQYRQNNFFKVCYGLIRNARCEKKAITTKFMFLLYRQVKKNQGHVSAIVLPQSWIKLLLSVVSKLGILRKHIFVVAHLESSNDLRLVTVMPMFYSEVFTVSKNGWGTQKSIDMQYIFENKYARSLVNNFALNKVTKIPSKLVRARTLKSDCFRVLVCFQIPWDETITFKSNVSWQQFADRIIQIMIANPNFEFLIRKHPHHDLSGNYLDKFQTLLSATNSLLSASDLYSDLEDSDLVIVINSGVGFEALMSNKPVVAFGDSIYKEYCADGAQQDTTLPVLIDDANQHLAAFQKDKQIFIAHNLFHTRDIIQASTITQLQQVYFHD